MKEVPTWHEEYIEKNSDGLYECFDEYDFLFGTATTIEKAKKIVENYFK